jgi:hypothetical protein
MPKRTFASMRRNAKPHREIARVNEPSNNICGFRNTKPSKKIQIVAILNSGKGSTILTLALTLTNPSIKIGI